MDPNEVEISPNWSQMDQTNSNGSINKIDSPAHHNRNLNGLITYFKLLDLFRIIKCLFRPLESYWICVWTDFIQFHGSELKYR